MRDGRKLIGYLRSIDQFGKRSQSFTGHLLIVIHLHTILNYHALLVLRAYFPCCTANLVLQDTIERIYVGDEYGDIERGIYLIRSENVVLLGEIVSVTRIKKNYAQA